MSTSAKSTTPTVSFPLLVDADVLIRAWRDNYPPDIFPSIWQQLQSAVHDGRLMILDHVFREVQAPQDLVTWMKQLRQCVYKEHLEQAVIDEFKRVARHLNGLFKQRQQHSPRNNKVLRNFLTSIKNFCNGSDAWLVAAALHLRGTIVTYEVRLSDAERQGSSQLKLPNVADDFKLCCIGPPEMLRKLGLVL